jgi:hypothetical protein
MAMHTRALPILSAREAAITLKYEFNSLGDALALCREHQPIPKPTALSNASREAFLLHARNLRTFFSAKTRNPDDIIVIDWLTPQSAFATPILDSLRPKLNKLLAHVTYSGASLPKDWPWEEIYVELKGNWRKFLDQLARDDHSLRKLFD